MPLPQFKDGTGRVWHPVITCQTLVAFEEETGESLFDRKTIDTLRAGTSLRLLMKLAFLACEDEREKMRPPMEFKVFAAAFVNKTQMESVAKGTIEAVSLFFLSQPSESQAKNEAASAGAGVTSIN